jgi:hypothetical protein
VAVRSKPQASGGSIAGIAVSNSAEGMFISCVCCVGSGLCDELIPRSEESYRVCVCLIVCDLETSKIRRSRPELDCCAKKKYITSNETSRISLLSQIFMSVNHKIIQKKKK